MKKIIFIFSSLFLLSACQSRDLNDNVGSAADTSSQGAADSAEASTDQNMGTSEGLNSTSEVEGSTSNQTEVPNSGVTGSDAQSSNALNNSNANQTVGDKASIEGQIVVDAPLKNALIKSPLKVEGQAVGPWFFEGSFPVRLFDDQGKELAKGMATSSENWMTEKMIPFTVTLNFNKGSATSGTLVLENDNPSGEADKAKKLEIPVQF